MSFENIAETTQNRSDVLMDQDFSCNIFKTSKSPLQLNILLATVYEKSEFLSIYIQFEKG